MLPLLLLLCLVVTMPFSASPLLLATLLPNTLRSIQSCAARIIANKLVAFPTETVYGLGANALDATAVEKIFQAKKRPATNPLIVHVLDAADCASYVNHQSSLSLDIFTTLTSAFWPGPLTLILPASSLIPPQVTANGPNVALRSPSNPIARALLRSAALPIAAPSANLYGHVSPTTGGHVMVDMEGEDVAVIDAPEGE